MKKIFFKLHLWLSIPFGIIIMLTCLSGASMIFETEITEALHPDRYFVKPEEGGQPMPLRALLAKVAHTLPDSVSVTGVTTSSNPERAWQVSLSKPRRASIYVNPYNGEVTGRNERDGFFMFMFRLHRWLLGNPSDAQGGIGIGKLIVGISTLLFVVVLISGIIIWWPANRQMLKSRLSISVGKGKRLFWGSLHTAGGMYAVLFLLAMALTGLTWSFSWYRTGFYRIFGVEAKVRGGNPNGGGERSQRPQQKFRQEGEHAAAHRGNGRANADGNGWQGKHRNDGSSSDDNQHRGGMFTAWQQVYEQLAQQNPHYKQITVSDGTAKLSMGHLGNRNHADTYLFDSSTGQITRTIPYAQSDASDRMFGWIYSIHTGAWGGWVTRILAFLAALLGASLPLTGYYLWIKKMKKAKQRK